MRRLGLIVVWSFALVGALVVVAGVWGWWRRATLAETLLRQVVAGAGVEVEGLEVASVDTSGVQLANLDLRWKGQALSVQSISADLATVVPPRLGEVALRGVVLRLQPTLLPATPDAARPAPEASQEGWPSIPLEKLKGDVLVQVGDKEDAAKLAFDFRGEESRIAGSVRTSLERSSFELSTQVSPAEQSIQFSWKDASFDLAELLARAQRFDPTLVPRLSVTGVARSEGVGAWEKGALKGEGTLRLEQGAVTWVERGVSVSGLRFEAQAIVEGPLWSVTLPRLHVEKAEAAGIAVSNVDIALSLSAGGTLEVQGVDGQIMGGRFQLARFTTDTAAPRVTSKLTLRGINLAELALLFGDIGADIQGRASGQIAFTATSTGLVFHGGHFSLDESAPATLTLRQKGLLTQGMDAKSLLFDAFTKIESGLLNLSVDRLYAEVLQEKGPEDISAVISVSGHPTDPAVKTPVDLKVNVRGPLAMLIVQVMKQNFSIESARP